MDYALNPTEEQALARFLKQPKVKKLLSTGGSTALVYSHASGIGRNVVVHVRDCAFTEFMFRDITDYTSW